MENLDSIETEWTKCSSIIAKKDKRGRPTSNPVPSHIKICSNCFSTITKGSIHTAPQCKNSKRTKVEKLVNISSPSTLQHAASRDRRTSDCPVTLLGPPKKEEEMKKVLFSSANCAVMQQDLGLSNSQPKIILRDIRNIVQKNAFMIIQEKNLQLETFFELSKLVYCLKEKETKIIKSMEFPTIVCSDLQGLINKVIEKLQRERDSVLIKISIDGGGGFLRFVHPYFLI